MGLNNEWSYDAYNYDYDYDSDFDNEYDSSDVNFEEWCDLYSTELLNDWFSLQENAQLYYHVNKNITFTKFCEFMFTPAEDLETPAELDIYNLWYSIGKPKSLMDFYKFYG